MAKSTVAQWDTTAVNNADVGGINIAEGCPPSNINNAIREVMAQIKTFSGTTGTALAAVAYSGSATDLTTGTLADARLPGTMSQKIFTGPVIGQNFLYTDNNSDAHVQFRSIAQVNRAHLISAASDGSFYIRVFNSDGTTYRDLVLTRTGGISWNGGTVWTSSNDGSGSGLDANLVNGLNSANTATASTIVARTGAGDILGVGIYAISGASSGTVFLGSNGTHYITYDGANWQIVAGDLYLDNGTALRFKTSGAALTSDGNITFAGGMLAYGSALSTAFEAKAGISQSSNVNETNFPVGQYLSAADANNRRALTNMYLQAAATAYSTASGTLCAGSWRQCGGAGGGVSTMQRVA